LPCSSSSSLPPGFNSRHACRSTCAAVCKIGWSEGGSRQLQLLFSNYTTVPAALAVLQQQQLATWLQQPARLPQHLRSRTNSYPGCVMATVSQSQRAESSLPACFNSRHACRSTCANVDEHCIAQCVRARQQTAPAALAML
jgi:hypothetical protein